MLREGDGEPGGVIASNFRQIGGKNLRGRGQLKEQKRAKGREGWLGGWLIVQAMRSEAHRSLVSARRHPCKTTSREGAKLVDCWLVGDQIVRAARIGLRDQKQPTLLRSCVAWSLPVWFGLAS